MSRYKKQTTSKHMRSIHTRSQERNTRQISSEMSMCTNYMVEERGSEQGSAVVPHGDVMSVQSKRLKYS